MWWVGRRTAIRRFIFRFQELRQGRLTEPGRRPTNCDSLKILGIFIDRREKPWTVGGVLVGWPSSCTTGVLMRCRGCRTSQNSCAQMTPAFESLHSVWIRGSQCMGRDADDEDLLAQACWPRSPCLFLPTASSPDSVAHRVLPGHCGQTASSPDTVDRPEMDFSMESIHRRRLAGGAMTFCILRSRMQNAASAPLK